MGLDMKFILTRLLFGIAACFWIIGLAAAVGTDVGKFIAGVAFFLIGCRFGPSIVKGDLRSELARSVPNASVRRYLMLLSYFIYAVPGVMNTFGYSLVQTPYVTYDRGFSRYAGELAAANFWPVAVSLSLLMPAVLVAVWSLSSRPAESAH